jgi:hypothetical protein
MRPPRNPPLLTTSPVDASWPLLVLRENVNTPCAIITAYKRSPAELKAMPVGPPGKVPVRNGDPGKGVTPPPVLNANQKIPPLSWSAV